MSTGIHNVLCERKHLLYYQRDYIGCMDTPADRLRHAREQAGYETAKAAAESMGASVSTYISHENGTRGFPAKRAIQYARKFKVTEEWLLYGKGNNPTGEKADVIDMWSRIPANRRQEAMAILKLLSAS
jgi:DNA-binding XRE family transcriptional regulator